MSLSKIVIERMKRNGVQLVNGIRLKPRCRNRAVSGNSNQATHVGSIVNITGSNDVSEKKKKKKKKKKRI
jgi:hypothetical protein